MPVLTRDGQHWPEGEAGLLAVLGRIRGYRRWCEHAAGDCAAGDLQADDAAAGDAGGEVLPAKLPAAKRVKLATLVEAGPLTLAEGAAERRQLKLAAGPSDVAAGPSSASAGPCDASAGRYGMSAGLSGAAAGPSGTSAGPSCASAGPSDASAALCRASVGPYGASHGSYGMSAGPSGASACPYGPSGASGGIFAAVALTEATSSECEAACVVACMLDVPMQVRGSDGPTPAKRARMVVEVEAKPAAFSLEPYTVHLSTKLGRSGLWCLRCFGKPAGDYRVWLRGRCYGEQPPETIPGGLATALLRAGPLEAQASEVVKARHRTLLQVAGQVPVPRRATQGGQAGGRQVQEQGRGSS